MARFIKPDYIFHDMGNAHQLLMLTNIIIAPILTSLMLSSFKGKITGTKMLMAHIMPRI